MNTRDAFLVALRKNHRLGVAEHTTRHGREDEGARVREVGIDDACDGRDPIRFEITAILALV